MKRTRKKHNAVIKAKGWWWRRGGTGRSPSWRVSSAFIPTGGGTGNVFKGLGWLTAPKPPPDINGLRVHLANKKSGLLSARHRPSHGMGGPRGVNITNTVVTELDFDPPATFDQAINNLQSLLRFLELIAGRRQNLLHIELELDLPKNCPGSILKLYWSSPPNRPTAADEQKPQPADLPLNGGIQPMEFAAVLERWLAVDRERGDARVQFSDGFAEGNRYDTARLVSSANMFDILPASAVPKDVELSEELQKAKSGGAADLQGSPAVD
jgi:hypothetical protein